MQSFGQRIDELSNSIQVLQSAINSYDLHFVSDTCGSDMYVYNNTIGMIHSSVEVSHLIARDAENLTSCEKASPLFKTVVHGPTCRDSVVGLSCLLGTSCGMLILGLIMLSTRAALYNPIINPRRRKRREREFKEYVEYMGAHYDTTDWKVDAGLGKEKAVTIQPAPTFETMGSDDSSPSRSADMDRSHDSLGSEPREESAVSSPRGRLALDESIHSPMTRRPHPGPAAHPLQPTTEDDPDVEYYSSDSEDEESVSGMTNISALVSRFFVVQRDLDGDSSFSSAGDRSVLNRSFRSLLGPALQLATPTRKTRRRTNRNDNAPFDESFDAPSELSLESEALTPSPDRLKRRQNMAPQKQHRSLLRTHGASNRTDIV